MSEQFIASCPSCYGSNFVPLPQHVMELLELYHCEKCGLISKVSELIELRRLALTTERNEAVAIGAKIQREYDERQRQK